VVTRLPDPGRRHGYRRQPAHCPGGVARFRCRCRTPP
jgi:hypothetical protein